MIELAAPVYLGWSLGANDASNVFGAAVTSRMIRFSSAAILASLCVVLGALWEGEAGMRTLGRLSDFDLQAAVTASIGAAIAVTMLTMLRLPVSTSQAVVGGIVGVGAFRGGIDLSGLTRVVACWVGTPIGGMLTALALYAVLRPLFNRLAHRPIAYDGVLRLALVAVGCYGAYALGANNVANVTGVYAGAGLIGPRAAATLGGVSIALGIVTYGRRVMSTVGRGVTGLNAYGALIVGLAHGITVHAYAKLGVPVSSSQAVVGAALGVGLFRGVETVRTRGLLGILSGWLATPLLAGAASLLLDQVVRHFSG